MSVKSKKNKKKSVRGNLLRLEPQMKDRKRKAKKGSARERHFVTGLLARSEAARPSGGKLPPGATHEIVDQESDTVAVVRRRFSAA